MPEIPWDKYKRLALKRDPKVAEGEKKGENEMVI